MNKTRHRKITDILRNNLIERSRCHKFIEKYCCNSLLQDCSNVKCPILERLQRDIKIILRRNIFEIIQYILLQSSNNITYKMFLYLIVKHWNIWRHVQLKKLYVNRNLQRYIIKLYVNIYNLTLCTLDTKSFQTICMNHFFVCI